MLQLTALKWSDVTSLQEENVLLAIEVTDEGMFTDVASGEQYKTLLFDEF